MPTHISATKSRVKIDRADGLNSYKLSRIVAGIRSIQGVKKNVLRVLADYYPNVFPSVETIADDAGWGTTKTRLALRELKNAGLTWVVGTGKGGRGRSTQYVLNVEAILAVHTADTEHHVLPLTERKKLNPTPQDGNPTHGVGFIPETQHMEPQNPTHGVGEHRSNKELKDNREERESPRAKDSSTSKPKAAGKTVREIQAFAFKSVGKIPMTKDVETLLAEYSQSDIEAAFGASVEGLDVFDRKHIVKNFFQNGGAHAVILSMQQDRESARKLAEVVRASIEAGAKKSAAEREAIFARIRAEEEAGQRFENNPFGDDAFLSDAVAGGRNQKQISKEEQNI